MWSYFISCLQESWEQIPVIFVIENTTTGWIQSLFAQYNLEINILQLLLKLIWSSTNWVFTQETLMETREGK